jgi:hypothetical protein
MPSKTLVYISAFIGSIVGGYIPTLWGAGFLSISSLVFSAIGGVAGIFFAIKYL